MNYYYDVLINLQDKYRYFYEWDETDYIIGLKKIFIVAIDSLSYEDFIKNIIKVDKVFLDKIYNKCKLKNGKTIPYICIFSDTKNACIIEFNAEGKSICKSSLLLEDELNICELAYSVDKESIGYEIIEKETVINMTYQEEKIKKYILFEVNKCQEDKNYNKLKFIFLEWFNYLEDDPNNIIKLIKEKLKLPITNKELEIYKIIKLSYNNV